MNVGRLVRKAKKGDKEALIALLAEEKDAFYRLALAYMKNEHDALEAIDEMAVIVYEKIGQLKKDAVFYSWSKTILVNVCKRLLKKQKRVVLLENPETAEEAGHNPYAAADRQMDIDTLLCLLNENQREAVILRYIHDLDIETIAGMTDVPTGTVKSRISTALKKMREQKGGDTDVGY